MWPCVVTNHEFNRLAHQRLRPKPVRAASLVMAGVSTQSLNPFPLTMKHALVLALLLALRFMGPGARV